MYAFIIPVLAYFLVETEGFGIGSLLPSVVFQTVGTGTIANLAGGLQFDWLPLTIGALPSISLAAALACMSYVSFQWKEKE